MTWRWPRRWLVLGSTGSLWLIDMLRRLHLDAGLGSIVSRTRNRGTAGDIVLVVCSVVGWSGIHIVLWLDRTNIDGRTVARIRCEPGGAWNWRLTGTSTTSG